ncbi:replication initiation and membrane attachment family protein [Sediminibacillus massiliensis]|uniref:replication initiation and membrane attachment family protein n=1 Tax=Sediminibacillus massiliensis TaxID=1926277 RepID=UPI00098874EE|nr:DnaD domain protein [Sediminibacillus massiliensis]
MEQQHIGKLLPIEGYQINLQKDLPTDYQLALTHLYQPLIGSEAVSLYQTLLSEYYLKTSAVEPKTHHTLMNYLSLPLDKIYQSRLRLEAIGLVNTYKKETSQKNIYSYVLNPPFSPSAFFDDGMLSQLLYHHIGENKYMELVQAFGEYKPKADIEGEEVTADFSDVFSTFPASADWKEDTPGFSEKEKTEGPTISANHANIDFPWIEQMLRQRMLPVSRILTLSNKKLVNQMVVLYGLTSQDVENAIFWAVNDENYLDVNEFKTACHDLFQSRQDKAEIRLVERTTSEETDKKKEPQTKEDKFMHLLENISPKQLLEDLSGQAASAQDLKVIRDVMSQQGLSTGVMNVLVHYVLLKTDMKLSKAYLEKIASHWARKNVKTVKQAMNLAKSENRKYQQWGNKKYYNKPANKEVIPDWFKERKQAESSNSESPVQVIDQGQETETEDIAALLKRYSES